MLASANLCCLPKTLGVLTLLYLATESIRDSSRCRYIAFHLKYKDQIKSFIHFVKWIRVIFMVVGCFVLFFVVVVF